MSSDKQAYDDSVPINVRHIIDFQGLLDNYILYI